MEKISTQDFLIPFKDIWNSNDRHICFVLGAGASKSSGIKTGGELADNWLREIEARFSDRPAIFQQFLTEREIDFENPGASYPTIYHERFRLDIASGFERINSEMSAARPKYGYSVLAQMLAAKHHNIVITTNFDNLTEEALYTYTDSRPLICGHESLASFARRSINRPLIIKIHRDRFLDPQSQPDEIRKLDQEWIKALNNIFNGTTIPVFIGYGGNDGSLMGYLEKLERIDNLFWCERKGVSISKKVITLLEKHNGKLVEIDGFDELMFMLQDRLELPLLDEELVKAASVKAREYNEIVKNIQSKHASSHDEKSKEAAERMVEKAGDTWLAWELRARAAKSNEERKRIYEDGLRTLPGDPELSGFYASLLHTKFGDYEQAEHLFKISLSGNENSACHLCNYATMLYTVRGEYGAAESMYIRALELSVTDPVLYTIYANFLKHVKGDYDKAEQIMLQTYVKFPDSADNTGNYAHFLFSIRRNYKQAESYFIRALKLDESHVNNNCNYGGFLYAMERRDEAEEYLSKALAIYNPESVDRYETDAILAEVFFYRYANGDGEEFVLNELQSLLDKGVRSIGFSLEVNVEQGIAAGHPQPELLRNLALQLTNVCSDSSKNDVLVPEETE